MTAEEKEMLSMQRAICRAWTDPEYRQRLRLQPREALQEMGVFTPEGVELRVLEDRSDLFTFVIPAPPGP